MDKHVLLMVSERLAIWHFDFVYFISEEAIFRFYHTFVRLR